MHVEGGGEAARVTHESFAPCAAGELLAFSRLRVALVHFMKRRIAMALIRAPALRVKASEAKRSPHGLQGQAGAIVPAATNIRQDVPGLRLQSVPEPPGISFGTHKRPHFVDLCFPHLLDKHGGIRTIECR